MKKDLRIVSIDGIRGVGKTSQAFLLCRYLESYDINSKLLKLEDNIESILDSIDKLWKMLEKEDCIVICDGSIARMIEVDIQRQMPMKDVYEKYRIVINEYEKLYHKYGMANLLITINEPTECQERINKRNSLFKESIELIDIVGQNNISSGLSRFDSYVFNVNIKFHTVETEKEDSMLDVRDDIYKILESNFNIKKPSI